VPAVSGPLNAGAVVTVTPSHQGQAWKTSGVNFLALTLDVGDFATAFTRQYSITDTKECSPTGLIASTFQKNCICCQVASAILILVLELGKLRMKRLPV
jgi:hypothetical protein